MATFSIKIPDNSFIPHEFDARQYTYPRIFSSTWQIILHFHLLSSFYLLSPTWNRGWTSGGVSNLLQLPNLSLVPLVRRNFRWTNEVTLFQPSLRSLVKIYRITVLISGRRKPKPWPSITVRPDDIHSISYLVTLNVSLLRLNPYYNLCIYIYFNIYFKFNIYY